MERVLGSLSWMADYSLVRVCDDMRLMSHGAVQGRIQLFRGEKLKTIPEPCTWQGVLGVDDLYLLSHKRSEALLLSPWARLGRLDSAEDIFVLERAPDWKKLVCQAVSSPQNFSFQEKHFVLASNDRPSFEAWWTQGNFSIYLQKISFLSQPPSYLGQSDIVSQRWVPVEVASVPAPPPQPAPPQAIPAQPAPARQNPPKRSFLGRAFLWFSGVAVLSALGCAACLGSWLLEAGAAGVGVLERALGVKGERGEESISPTEPHGGSPSKPLVKPKKLGEPLTNSVGMTFQQVSAGSFKWASKSGRSARVEITRPFLIQTTEVTVDQWVAVMGADPSMERACGGACPVELVSWYDALLFANKLSEKEELAPCYKLSRCKPSSYATLGCSRAYEGKDQGGWCGKGAKGRDNSEYNYECEQVLWVSPDCEGYRLPTEAEWELAARAGETGPQYGALDKIAWGGSPNAEEGCPKGAKHPVAKKVPNALGLYDVLGNVAEWVWDVYEEHPEADQEDPSGPGGSGTRVFRGGSECQSFEEDLRLDARRSSHPINRSRAVGFRLARSWER
jgi:formylglycine-generating enzyme required for sulfatase activity